MKSNVPAKKQKLYFNILISMTLSIVITMLILSTVLYVNFENIALDQVYTDSMNSLTQTSQGVALMTNMAVTLSNQIYQDLSVARLLYYEHPETYDIRVAMDQLTNYRLTVPFIDSVYVYNGKTNTIYINAMNERGTMREAIQSKDSFDDEEALDIFNKFNRYKISYPVSRKLVLNEELGIEKYYYSFLLYDTFSGENLDSAVIVNISQDWIYQNINNNSTENSGEILIIDSAGRLMCNTKNNMMLADLSSNSYIKKILESPGENGYFTDLVNDHESIVTYTQPDSNGWTYISIIPKNILFSKIEGMKLTTVLFGLAILVFGVVLAVFISRKLYNPIKKILQSAKILEEENKSNVELIRKGILKDILLGRETSNDSLLQEKLSKLDGNYDKSGIFRIILLKIDNYKYFCNEYSPEDRKLFRFGIMNISEEILSEDSKVDTIDMGEGTLVAILNMESIHENFRELQENQISRIQEAVNRYIKVSLTCVISTDTDYIENLGVLYQQVLEGALYRFFYGHASIIYYEKVKSFKEKAYNYPFHKEKLMVDALMVQKIDEAKGLYNEIINGTMYYSYSEVNLAVSRLVFTVNDVVNTIRKNNSLFSDFEIRLSFGLGSQCETIDDMNSQFYELFDELNSRLEERKNSKHEELIKKIDEIIEADYSVPVLSIDSIAGILEISPTYMCRLYKQYTLSTILDKIVNVRMNVARKLLLDTRYSVAEISEKTSFTNSSYFYKAFKKYNGTTPSDFRSKKGGRFDEKIEK